jgi:hypothetical protein
MMASPFVSKHLVPDGVRFSSCSRISVSIFVSMNQHKLTFIQACISDGVRLICYPPILIYKEWLTGREFLEYSIAL